MLLGDLQSGESHAILYIVARATWIAGVAQLVERHLAKVQVAGSNPVSRSNPYK